MFTPIDAIKIIQPAGFPSLPDDWILESDRYPSSDSDERIFAMSMHSEPWTSPRTLVVVHGMGEHSGRYLHAAHFLKNHVNAIFCPDLRGHGRSEGKRGHIDHFDSLCDDLRIGILRLDEKLRDKFGKSEIHLLGHSVGGHIVLRSLLNHPDLPVLSASVSAPLLAIKAKVPPIKKAAAQLLVHLCGSLALKTGLNLKSLSQDPGVISAYSSDPLNHDKMTPTFFVSMLSAFQDTLDRKGVIKIPIQLLAPQKDQVADTDTSIRFFEQLSAPRKSVKLYPDFYHESLNEIGKETAFKDIGAWIDAHQGSNWSLSLAQ